MNFVSTSQNGEKSICANWKGYELKDAYADNSEPSFLVERLIQNPSLSIFFGAPGSLKSFVLADLALCVAAGIPWLSPCEGATELEGFSTNQAKVLWIDLDNGRQVSIDRFAAIGRAHNLPESISFKFYTLPEPWPYVTDEDITHQLIDLIQFEKAKLVILDNLGNIRGEIEENSSGMERVMSNLKLIKETTKAAIILIHHMNKKGMGGDGRAGNALRGHSSIEAALDLAVAIERQESTEEIVLTPTKSRGFEIKPFQAKLEITQKANSFRIDKACFVRIMVDKKGTANKKYEKKTKEISNEVICESILDQLGTDQSEMDQLAKNKLLQLVKKSLVNKIGKNNANNERIESCLYSLIDDEKVKVVEKEHGEATWKYYSRVY